MKNRTKTAPIYKTKLGEYYLGDTKKVLATKKFKKFHQKIQLVFTSPPFPLIRKKSYGNEVGEEYIEWIKGYAKDLVNLVTEDGSIVMEIGNAWVQSQPVMSTVVMKAFLAFLEEGGLHLCQEFIWYNPARLPSPAQWVNIERIRVKDSFTRIWWMSPTPRPKADNRNILKPYSESMNKLLETGKYNSGKRPSEFVIGEQSFNKNNNGAIPPNVISGDDATSITNLLKIANTKSTTKYREFCKKSDIKLHPARMPTELAEFFIKFVTDEGDLVLDPFAGSNTTGYIAEKLLRNWISIERDIDYAKGSMGRFEETDFIYVNRSFLD